MAELRASTERNVHDNILGRHRSHAAGAPGAGGASMSQRRSTPSLRTSIRAGASRTGLACTS